jgi:chitodextrinase
MKTRPHCNGTLYRHAKVRTVNVGKGARYRCSNPNCRKTFTVRHGEVSTLSGRPPKKDWRHV